MVVEYLFFYFRYWPCVLMLQILTIVTVLLWHICPNYFSLFVVKCPG
jgi:hypothetical protein